MSQLNAVVEFLKRTANRLRTTNRDERGLCDAEEDRHRVERVRKHISARFQHDPSTFF